MKENKKEKEPFKQRMQSDARNCLKDIRKRDIIILILVAIGVNFVIETLALMKYDGIIGALLKLLPNFSISKETNVFAGFISIFTHPIKVLGDPLIFLYNSTIVMAVLSLSLLFKKRYFVMTILSAGWIGFGIANFVVLSYRVTPFSAVELKLIDAAVGVMKSYVTSTVFIIVVLAILLLAALLVFVWLKAPSITNVNRFSALILIVAAFVFLNAGTVFATETGLIAEKLPNLSVNYQEYGFVYCFVSSFKTGIGKPSDYSPSKIQEIQANTKYQLDGVTSESVDTDKEEVLPTGQPQVIINPAVDTKIDDSKLPNVIFLQLESFFDITALEGLEVSEDPIPTFHSCLKNFPSGYLNVPSVGAGTANTEFEIITGMDLDFFGPGEYPYKTVLKTTSCETICYNLKNHGLAAHAIHNNRANFYNRNSVFRRFGFDTFTSIELMDVKEYTPNGWAKDKILTGEILKTLKSTESKDYIYTISVQGHGEYPDEPMVGEIPIKVTGGIEDATQRNRIEYYVNQIKEMDTFLSELIAELEAFGEDTILVAYGDHLPNLDIKEESLTRGTMFQTEYFIWNNMALDMEDEDIEAYQLSSKVLDAIDVKDGAINAYHQANWALKGTEEYLDNLEILGYDMLYGDNNATGGVNVYQPKDKIQYGVENVSVTSAYRDQSDTDYLIIKGNHFTNYSAVYINGEKVSSKCIDPNTLRLQLSKQTEDIGIVVKQCYKSKLVLQTSNEIIYSCTNERNVYDDGDNTENQDPEEEDFVGMLEQEIADMDEQLENQQVNE